MREIIMKNALIYVVGHSGPIALAITRNLSSLDCKNILIGENREVELTGRITEASAP